VKVQAIYSIRGRGVVVVVPRGEAEGLSVGAYVSRGEHVWRVTGIDTARRSAPTDPVGIYLSGDVPPAVGDDLRVARPRAAYFSAHSIGFSTSHDAPVIPAWRVSRTQPRHCSPPTSDRLPQSPEL